MGNIKISTCQSVTLIFLFIMIRTPVVSCAVDTMLNIYDIRHLVLHEKYIFKIISNLSFNL